jgi:hypothetical protein
MEEIRAIRAEVSGDMLWAALCPGQGVFSRPLKVFSRPLNFNKEKESN